MSAAARHFYVVDDLALLVVDWSMHGTGHHGRDTHLAGTATDVARRGADGTWRYAINNPFGATDGPSMSGPHTGPDQSGSAG